jgi:hypothetical protein
LLRYFQEGTNPKDKREKEKKETNNEAEMEIKRKYQERKDCKER